METTEERVCAFDVSCECGAQLLGAWSGEACDDWAEEHECLSGDD